MHGGAGLLSELGIPGNQRPGNRRHGGGFAGGRPHGTARRLVPGGGKRLRGGALRETGAADFLPGRGGGRGGALHRRGDFGRQPGKPGAARGEDHSAHGGSRPPHSGKRLCAAMGTDRAGVEELWEDSLGGRAQFYAYDTAEREPAQLFSVPMAPVSFPETLSGDYEAACAPLAPEWFPLELAPFLVTIHAVGENQPFLMDAQDAGAGAYVRFFREITGADRLTLWVSEDGGKSWRGAEEYSGQRGAFHRGPGGGAGMEPHLSVPAGGGGRPHGGTLQRAGISTVRRLPRQRRGQRDDDDRGDLGELPAGTSWCRPRKAPQGKAFPPQGRRLGKICLRPARSPGKARRGPPRELGKARRSPAAVPAWLCRRCPPPSRRKLRPRFGRSCWAGRWLWRRERRCWACAPTAPAGMGSGERGADGHERKTAVFSGFRVGAGAVGAGKLRPIPILLPGR